MSRVRRWPLRYARGINFSVVTYLSKRSEGVFGSGVVPHSGGSDCASLLCAADKTWVFRTTQLRFLLSGVGAHF